MLPTYERVDLHRATDFFKYEKILLFQANRLRIAPRNKKKDNKNILDNGI